MMTRGRRQSLRISGGGIVLLSSLLLALHLCHWNDTISSILENIRSGFYYVTRIPVGDVFLYSAVADPDDQWEKFPSVTISAWDGSQNKIFNCCFFTSNNKTTTISAHASVKNNFGYSPLAAVQYQCKLTRGITNITRVGLIEHWKTCSQNILTIPVLYPTTERGKIAICAKIAYGSLSPQRLIEWFEYQRLMGVDKVLVMVQYLNEEAYDVLLYYKDLGLAEIEDFPSPLPGTVIGYPDRGFEEDRFTLPQCSHDKQVGVYNCQQKLQGYDFVAIIDFDEYVVHDKFMNYKDLLQKELLPQYPDAAGFTFNVSFFILNWGDNGSGNLYLTKYAQRTEPRYECFKNIYIPERIKEATTHTFQSKSAFKRYILSSHNVVIHHYRECPKVPQWKNCMTEPRTVDFKMLEIKQEMEQNVKLTQKQLGFA